MDVIGWKKESKEGYGEGILGEKEKDKGGRVDATDWRKVSTER